MFPSSLSIFFPMYNELPHIETLLTQASIVIPKLGFNDYEIIVIDDGSQDGCDLVVEDYSKSNPHIRLVRHGRNRGYGAALRTGFLEACKEAVFYTDSDLPVDLADLSKALPLLEKADLVIGYRIKRYETPRRAVLSRLNNWLEKILFGVSVHDVNFSFKLVRRQVLQTISLTAETGFIDGQLLAEAVRHGFRIVEIPICYTPRSRGRSNFDRFEVAWNHLIEMTTYWAQHYLPRRPVERPASIAEMGKPIEHWVE
jgi:glycosyltransferase involved in cell wall biosynthesis